MNRPAAPWKRRNPVSACNVYEPRDAKRLFGDTEPFALLDIREQREFEEGHLYLGSSVPASRLEFAIETMVPCRNVPVIVYDNGGDDFRAEAAARKLRDLGYEKAALLRGGIAAWLEAGFVLMDGFNSMTKGYAELLEDKIRVPGLQPDEVRQRLAKGEKIVFLDIRPREEYEAMNIPGALNAPGCEVVYRFLDLAPDPDALVLTNCAARTRGILCAQALLNIGVPNRVASLRGGTMNWAFTGGKLGHGTAARTSPPSAKALAFASDRARKLADDYGIRFVDAATVDQWRKESATFPLYLCDVRQPEEYEAGHLPGSRCLPGGQLTLRLDEYTAVRNARFVLMDDTEVRAIVAAYWLRQLGQPRVYVLKGGLGGSGYGTRGLERGPEKRPAPRRAAPPSTIDAAALAEELKSGMPLVLNVGSSAEHAEGHVPGAVWVPRASLPLAAKAHPDATAIVLTADCEEHAGLAAEDARALWNNAEIRILAGGNAAWKAPSVPVETGMPRALTPVNDCWDMVYQNPNPPEEKVKTYFDWEMALGGAILKDGSLRYHYPKQEER